MFELKYDECFREILLPKEFLHFYEYVNELKFDEEPDYTYLKSLFNSNGTKKLDYNGGSENLSI